MITASRLQHEIRGVLPVKAGLFVLLFSALAPANTLSQTAIDQAAKLIQRAQDTENPRDFRQAGDAAEKALAEDPQSFDAQRYQAMALLGQQNLTAALDIASKLNQRVPDDIGIWALLSEIHASRGDYAEAERCAQWVLDLRRNSPLGFRTAAQLREIFGDYEGAAEFYSEALRRTSQADSGERSWLMARSALMQLRLNNRAGAASIVEQAEKLFPDSLQVLEQRAELAHRKGDFGEAASALARESQDSPTAAHLYAWGQALERAGKVEEARAAFEKLQADPRGDEPAFVLYFADREKNSTKALDLATRRIAARQDVATLDAYAWALFRAGKFAEARTQIDKLLSVGTRDPQYVCHAAQIATQTPNIESAATHLPEGSCETIP